MYILTVILSIYFTIQLVLLLLTWNYFKNFRIVLKNIDLFKTSSNTYNQHHYSTCTINNFNYTIKYNMDDHDICLLFSYKNSSNYNESNVMKMYTNILTFILLPSYISYYYYIKYKLKLN